MTTNQWGADVPVSMPQPLPPGLDSMIPMGGFTMTVNGLYPDLNQADHERISKPGYAPHNPDLPVDETPFQTPAPDREWT